MCIGGTRSTRRTPRRFTNRTGCGSSRGTQPPAARPSTTSALSCCRWRARALDRPRASGGWWGSAPAPPPLWSWMCGRGGSASSSSARGCFTRRCSRRGVDARVSRGGVARGHRGRGAKTAKRRRRSLVTAALRTASSRQTLPPIVGGLLPTTQKGDVRDAPAASARSPWWPSEGVPSPRAPRAVAAGGAEVRRAGKGGAPRTQEE